MISPQGGAFRTLAACSDGNGYSGDLSPAVDNAAKYLDDKWNWQTGGQAQAQGHYKGKKITLENFIESIWYDKQSQIVVFAGHGGEGFINLKDDDSIFGDDFNWIEAEGNWGECQGTYGEGAIPGTIFLFSTCKSSKSSTEGASALARDGGARLTVGHDGEVLLTFAKIFTRAFSKKLVQDAAYKIDQIAGKAYSLAKSECWWATRYPGYQSYYWTNVQKQKPRKEYDFDSGGVGVDKGISLTVGGTNPLHADDDGAFFYLKCDVENDNDRIKVEYKKGPTWLDPWTTFNTYMLEDEIELSNVPIGSQPIVIRFDDDYVKSGHLQIRVTNLDGYMDVSNARVHIVSE